MKKNYTIDCVSPLINYQPPAAWIDGNAADTKLNQYSGYGHTFRLTRDQSSRLSFSFNGTGIWVYGAKRGNHGLYAVTIDDSTPQVRDGFAADDLFQTVLFGAQDLTNRPHTVEITNQIVTPDRPYFDVDFIIWEAEVPDNSSVVSVVDDNSSAFEWLPSASTWSTGCSSISEYSGQTCHVSSSATASAKISFIGDSVALYGAVGPSYGPYVVQLDSQPSARLNAFSESFRPQQVMYFADKLGPGVHTLVVTNNPAKLGDLLNIDYIQVTGPTSNPTNLNSTDAGGIPELDKVGTKSSGLGATTAAIIGASVAVVVILAIVVGLWYFLYWRPRRNLIIRHQSSRLDMDSTLYPPRGYLENGNPQSFVQTLNGQSQISISPEMAERYRDTYSHAYSVEPPTTIEPSLDGRSEGITSTPVATARVTNRVQIAGDFERALPVPGVQRHPQLDSHNETNRLGIKSLYEAPGTGSDDRINPGRRRESIDYDPPPRYS